MKPFISNLRESVEIGPQAGPQTTFLSSSADIAIYGGAAGGGKSWALLMEPLRHVKNSNFGSITFRRTSVQIRNEGGLWDESVKLYMPLGAKPKEHDLWWKFPSGSALAFAHLEHEKNVYDYQGSQIPLICFDELTHFTSKQFWYMVSRNRSMCGVRPYIRATCNPDVDSWVADLIAWWINQDTGYPIPERAGVIRWFIRIGEKLIWGDKPEDLSDYRNPETNEPIQPKSLTFIPAKLTDNKILMDVDAGYMANLMALSTVERERLLAGNWKIRWSDASFFDIQRLLVGGQPVEVDRCEYVFAVIDCAVKTGSKNDGTGVIYFSRDKINGHDLAILDWDYQQILGAHLEDWLPTVFTRLEELAKHHKARLGLAGVFIEDKSGGEILLQQAMAKNMLVHPIESGLTALGKDERALNASPYVNRGEVKIIEEAYYKVMDFKGASKNHLISQVSNFRISDEDGHKRADDLLDAFCYGIAIGLGNHDGF